MNISMIAAISKNWGIGKNGQLLCYIPDDLKRFKKLTLNKTIIMGRKTYSSLPNGALKNRENIILSKNKQNFENCKTFHSINEILKLNRNEIFIIGGSQIYKQFMKHSNNLYLTFIHGKFNADTFFPQINDNWIETYRINNFDENKKISYSFVKFDRKI